MMAPMPGYAAGMAPVAYAYPPEYAAMPGKQRKGVLYQQLIQKAGIAQLQDGGTVQH